MSRALLRGIKCHACRNSVIRSFVSMSGVTITPLALGSVSTVHTRPPQLSRNFSSQHAKLFLSQPSDNTEPAAHPILEKDTSEEISKHSEEPEEHIPWYLQEEVEDSAPHPLRKQQPLPALPENPPPILKDLLEHISVDIGLDNLSLLDLRQLDPPPALGANLIMIFGSARGVKHLNVSADRLCRWLRTTYKLRPNADGLLGRNELKIKLRRKARRAKLAKSAKSTLTQPDDGITTGWICVDVGTVEGGQFCKPEEGSEKVGFVGFGTVVEGTRIVVQMMTEEKREEIDLEGLWSRTLERNSLENEGLPRPQAEEPPKEADLIHEPSIVAQADSSHRLSSHAPQISVTFEQRRGISTSSRQHQDPKSTTGDFVRTSREEDPKPPGKKKKFDSTSLTALSRWHRNISPVEAIRDLGQGVHDKTSTTFLQQFYQELAKAPSDLASSQRIKLMCTAIVLHHPGYSKTDLFEAFQEHILSNYIVTRPQFLQILDALLSFKPDLSSDPPRLLLPSADMQLALQIIDHVGLRGVNLLDATIIIKLFVGASFRAQVYPVSREDLPSSTPIGNRIPVPLDTYESVKRIQSRLARVIKATRATLTSNQYMIILRVFFNQGEYLKFWNTWQEVALAGASRDKSFYLFIFQLHAESDGWQRWTTNLLNCIQMMEQENPPVHMDGEFAETIARCITVACPDILARVGRNEPGPLVKVWRQCQILLQNEAGHDEGAGPHSAISRIEYYNRRTKFKVHITSQLTSAVRDPAVLEPNSHDISKLRHDHMEYMSTLQNDFDDFKPSLFEILSEQQLSALLPPSLRYILAVATHRHPRYLLRVLNSYDELYALLSLLVERYYLRTFGGSFTENFYSLKRERVLATKNGEIPRAQLGAASPVRETLKLRSSDVWKNLAVMVGIPYLKRKLDEGYDIHAAPHAALASSGGGPRYNPADDLPPSPTARQRLMHYYKWFLRNVYPSLNAAYYFAILAFNLAYLFDNTKYSSPFLWLIGTRIRRLGPADHAAIELATQPPKAKLNTPNTRPGGALSFLSPQNIYPHLLGSLKIFLPTSIFALKFLEWWHASDFSRQLARKATEALDLPAPVVSGMIPPTAATASGIAAKPQKASASDQSSEKPSTPQTYAPKRPNPPISSTSYLPIFTVPLPAVDPTAALSDPAAAATQSPCPICLNPLNNPTACQTGYIFCYSCIFRWVNGEHERQIGFMNGEGSEWEDVRNDDGEEDTAKATVGGERGTDEEKGKGNDMGSKISRVGKWESGKGRCAVTGRRVLGGPEGLRKVLV
ncbi:ATPase synthesis protein 25, mitochondrial [Emergomyces pasteurianus Ep9510]|uniref:ATPase synthesis protein 25 n=1 Tax=Emergomyces pasteurianus Ep9510 TaxID=1447872 RepID=A0A1J9QRX9_9EURO|nr:ATPase synthesis protein 25, mitochondrial [Emergomyces pasteurianus Ep9510]